MRLRLGVGDIKVSERLESFEEFLGFFRHRRHSAERRQVEKALESLCRVGRVASKGFNPTLLNRLLVTLSRTQMEPTSKEFTAQELRRISHHAQNLAQSVRRLRRSSFIVASSLAGHILPGDLLHVDFFNTESIQTPIPPGFKTIIELPALAKWYRTNIPQGTEGYLRDLCGYLKKTTGRWNDAEVVGILQPLGIPHAESESALKMWRNRAMKR